MCSNYNFESSTPLTVNEIETMLEVMYDATIYPRDDEYLKSVHTQSLILVQKLSYYFRTFPNNPYIRCCLGNSIRLINKLQKSCAD